MKHLFASIACFFCAILAIASGIYASWQGYCSFDASLFQAGFGFSIDCKAVGGKYLAFLIFGVPIGFIVGTWQLSHYLYSKE